MSDQAIYPYTETSEPFTAISDHFTPHRLDRGRDTDPDDDVPDTTTKDAHAVLETGSNRLWVLCFRELPFNDPVAGDP